MGGQSKVCAEADFIKMIEQHGPSEASRRLGVSLRSLYGRRANIEGRIGRQIKGPDKTGRATRLAEPHPGRLQFNITDGVILIGSDAHYWSGPASTAHRAFVQFCKELKPKIVIMNGDVMDGAGISRHAPIGWEHRPSLIQEIEACQERLGEIVKACSKVKTQFVWPLGNHDCLDIQTECLTRRGWLRHCDLKADDQILSKVGGRPVWSAITEIVSFPFAGNLTRIEKTRMSMAVTDNHRVLLRRLNWRTQHFDIEEYRSAHALPYSFDIPVAAQTDTAGVLMSDDQLRLAGWILTDGCFGPYDISIYQSKVKSAEIIQALLERMEISYSHYVRERESRVICGRPPVGTPLPAQQFYIKSAHAKEIRAWLPNKKHLPWWAYELSSRQFDIFLDAIVAGDGCWDGYSPEKKTCCVIYGTHKILSDLQAAAVCHGWRARIATDTRGAYRLWLAKEPKIRVEKPEIFQEPYEGVVWCLRVPHENFMVRRNGCAYFTGNSRFETRLATVAPEYGRIKGVHLSDHFGAEWQPCWSAFINDNVVVKHRFKNGIHAVHNATLWAGRTMITGHLHSLKVTPLTDYTGTRWGVDTGTMAHVFGPQFADYTEDNPRNWRSGFAVLTFKDGELLWPETVHAVRDGVVDFRGQLIEV